MNTRAMFLGMKVLAWYMHMNGNKNINILHYYSLCPYPTNVIRKSEILTTHNSKKENKKRQVHHYF